MVLPGVSSQCAVCDHFVDQFVLYCLALPEVVKNMAGNVVTNVAFRYFSVIVFIYFKLVLDNSASLGGKNCSAQIL